MRWTKNRARLRSSKQRSWVATRAACTVTLRAGLVRSAASTGTSNQAGASLSPRLMLRAGLSLRSTLRLETGLIWAEVR